MDESSLKKIINTDHKRSIFWAFLDAVLWIVIICSIIWVPLFVFFSNKADSIFTIGGWAIGALIFMAYTASILTLIFLLSNLPEYILRELIKQGEIIDGIMMNELNSVSDVSQILSTTTNIYKRSRISSFLRNTFFFLFSKPLIRGIALYHQETIQSAISVLTDLRSDLATRLTEQQKILESAKTEVEKNITGTPELLAVSEAQKLRLDRQIEQFEELQRVLVRV